MIWLILIPFLASILAFFLPLSGKSFKTFAVGLSLIPLAMLLYGNSDWIGDQIQTPWIPALSIQFYIRIDALCLLFLYLTAIIVPISIMAMPATVSSPNMFYGLVLLLQGLLMGFFMARDLALFTIFWESMLLPLYFIINIWGGVQRQMASLKFLIYMLAGSALMVAAVLSLYFSAITLLGTGTFNLDLLAKISSEVPYSAWICAIFLLAFAVKAPLFPFHAWLPDTYYQAPVTGTILLSALLSKAGIYGILRISLGLFPMLMQEWTPLLTGLAIFGVLYGGLAAWMQNDFKRLIAYSSFSHINFILAGLFVWNLTSQSGAIFQSLNHGITITALFLVAWWLEERIGTTSIGNDSGLAKYMPKLCWLTLFFVLASVALPGTNNFIGELMILFGIFSHNPTWATILAFSIILSVVYMLRWMQKTYFETPKPFQASWVDIKWKHLAVALPLILLILWLGIYPRPILKLVSSSRESVVAIQERG